MNRDRHGIIGQIQPDGSIEGGDSACWMGAWLYLNNGKCPDTDWNSTRFIHEFEVSHGAYVRHPDPAMSYNGFAAYYKNPWDGVISRDQYHGVLAGIISAGDRAALFRALTHHFAWCLLFMYNTRINGQDPATSRWKWPDLTLMDIWALYIRGFNAWYLYPLLLVFDLQLLLASIFVESEPVEKDDIINHLIKVIIAKDRLPTPLSWLARKCLSYDRVKAKLDLYWGAWRNNPEFIEKYLERLDDL